MEHNINVHFIQNNNNYVTIELLVLLICFDRFNMINRWEYWQKIYIKLYDDANTANTLSFVSLFNV